MVFYDDFLISREVTKITSIYYLCRVKIKTAMKRNHVCSILAMCMASALILSCEPMEPSSYTEYFYRIASVNLSEGKASLKFDYTGEKYNLDNFKTKTDMDRFELSHGDRILARLEYSAIGSVGKITLKSADVYPTYKLAESRPADTLNNDCRFSTLTIWEVQYPAIWAQGHMVNMAPIYYVPNLKCKNEFYLYPLQMKQDTLEMRLYSYIPDNDLSLRGFYEPAQTWLCYDISSLRDSVADIDEFNHRKQILNQIDKLKGDSMMVHIFQPDTLWGMLDTIYYERYPRVSLSVKIPRDF